MNNVLPDDNFAEEASQFRRVAERIAVIAKSYALSLQAYHSPDLPFYGALPKQKRTEAPQQIKLFLTIMQGAEVPVKTKLSLVKNC